jgi:MFS family permease
MLAAMCLSTFMVQIDVTIVKIALPRIQSGLGTSAGNLEWVISAYALTLATLIPISGVLGDRFGRKRLFMIGWSCSPLARSCVRSRRMLWR